MISRNTRVRMLALCTIVAIVSVFVAAIVPGSSSPVVGTVLWAAALVGLAVTVVLAGGRHKASGELRWPRFNETVAMSTWTMSGVAVAHLFSSDTPRGWSVLAFCCLLAAHLLQLLTMGLSLYVQQRMRSAIQWRNTDPGLPALRPVRRWESSHALALTIVPAWLGVTGAMLGAGVVVLVTGLAVSLLATLCIAADAAAKVLANRKVPGNERLAAAVGAHLGSLRPEILLHFNGPANSAHVVNQWMATLEALDARHRVLIMIREAHHLDRVETGTLPIVFTRTALDTEQLLAEIPSIELAMYPHNTQATKHVLRLLGIYDVYINHGESDKLVNANPVTRAYDEAWVVGQAAKDRYLGAGLGIREDQLRIVGRPQLEEIRQADSGAAGGTDAGRITVLYAPTWEGYYESVNYGSVPGMGRRIVDELLADRNVRVLFKPHPTTGQRDPEAAAAVEEITARIAQAGGDHRVLTTLDGLYSAFNESDVMIADISSVVVDYLATGKPYLVTNPRAQDDAEFVAEFPSTAGGHRMTPDGVSDLHAVIEEARTSDPLAADRAKTAEYMLGVTHAPLAFFLDRVDECLAEARAKQVAPSPQPTGIAGAGGHDR